MAFMTMVTYMLHRLCSLQVHNRIRIVKKLSLHLIKSLVIIRILQYGE
jgi:hypothetical protein